ncbi:MAG: Gldg family protein [Acidobacteriia bacterium]|nr:Gldg family protein [Terriglobia bacterium]
MEETGLKRLSRWGGGLGILAVALGTVLYSAHSVFDWKVRTALGVGIVLLILYAIFHFRDLQKGWMLRSTQYGVNTLVTVIVFAAILGLLNYLGARHHKRVDLTTNKLFSLSEQTAKFLKDLHTDFELVYFDQKESSDTRDLIHEYLERSSHLKYRFVDAEKNLEEAKQFGVTSIPTIVVVAAQNSGQKQLVNSATEEDLTNALVKLTRQKQKAIYFTEGHGEASLAGTGASGFSRAKQGLENQGYEVKTLNLVQSKTVPDDCSVLVIAGPHYAFLQPEVNAVESYVNLGGKLFLLVDPEISSGFEADYAKWKIQVDDDAAVDASGIGQILGLGPAAPIVVDYENQPIVKDFGHTMTIFPLARSVRVADTKSDFSASSLLKTSANSWGEIDLKERPLRYDKGKDIEGPLSLAVVSSCPVTPPAGQVPRSKESRVEVIGNSRFAANQFFPLQRNGDLFLNSVSWLAEDEDLVSIRPKQAESRQVELSASTARLLSWFMIIVMPAIALLSGATVWARRRRR